MGFNAGVENALWDRLSHWTPGRGGAPKTQDRQERGTRLHIIPYRGRLPLRSIADLRAFVANLESTVSSVDYQRGILSELSSILEAAVGDKRLARNPVHAKSARWPKSPRERRGAWPMATALRVRDAVNERNRIAVVVGPGRGLRQGEVFGLSPKDIDRERGMLHVRRQVRAIYGRLYFTSPKGKKIRTVDLPPRWPRNSGVTSKCSRQLGWSCRGGSRRGRGRSLPCCSPPASATPSRGTHGTPTPASRPWPRPVSSRHVPRGRKPGSGRRPRTDGFPVLRHTYASTMLEAGESVVTMARWLGHSSPAITLGYYAHFMPDAGSKGARHHRRSAWEGRGIGSLAETPQILPGAVDRRFPPLRPAVVLR